MVSVTLSVPKETKELMDNFPEMNWSGFVRNAIEGKTKKLLWKEEMLKKLKDEDESGFTKWTIDMGRKANEGIAQRLKKEGLL